MHIFIGTKNPYKTEEMTLFLKDLPGISVHPWSELDLKINIDEDQPTLKANAEKKAVEISKLTDWYVLTSDGGVDIPGLGDKWDILKNQRTVGEDSTDLEKSDKLLGLMTGLTGDKRKVTYYLSLALAKNGRLLWSTQHLYDHGYLVEELPDRQIPQGLWMSHLWYYPQYGRVFNHLNEKEKDEVRKPALGLKQDLEEAIKTINNQGGN